MGFSPNHVCASTRSRLAKGWFGKKKQCQISNVVLKTLFDLLEMGAAERGRRRGVPQDGCWSVQKRAVPHMCWSGDLWRFHEDSLGGQFQSETAG